MAYLVKERRGNTRPDHPLARDANYGNGVFPTARQARSCPPYGCTMPSLEVADDRRDLVIASRDPQRVCRRDVKTCKPNTGFRLAPLRQCNRKNIELR